MNVDVLEFSIASARYLPMDSGGPLMDVFQARDIFIHSIIGTSKFRKISISNDQGCSNICWFPVSSS